ncbi:MAG: murein biosynthesis integral membrane protein MurJ [Hyphomicrobiaceae bacterium]
MKLYRAFATVGGMTMASRVLGFVRDILIAAMLGTGPIADAFFVAFRLPNLFRRLFGEGAFNAAFVPIFAKRLEGEGARSAERFANEALSVLFAALVVFTVAIEIVMPLFMMVFAYGYRDTPEKFDLAVMLTRIMFPYLLCMSLVALLSGVLNSLRKFALASAAPILLNVVLIAVMLVATRLGIGNSVTAGVVLAGGVMLSGVVQLGVLAIAARSQGMRLMPRWPRMTGDVGRLFRLAVPGIIASGIIQFNLMIGTMIASMQDGAVSFLYYADRIYQLPLGVVGVAIGVVLLPDIARHLRAGDMSAVSDSQNRAAEFALLLTLPAAVAIAVSAGPIVKVLFERGAFSPDDTVATAGALSLFAVGLPAFVLIKVLSPAFFAREDTKTPMYVALGDMLVNVVVSVALFWYFSRIGIRPHYGIAIATSAAGWVNAILLFVLLRRRGHFELDARLRTAVPLIALASAVMGAALWFLGGFLAPHFEQASGNLVQAAALVGLVAVGMVVFGVVCEMTGAARLAQIVGGLKRR